MNEFLGPIDVARQLGCSTDNVRLLEKTGRLAALRTPSGRRIFRREDVDRLAAERDRQRGKTDARDVGIRGDAV